MKPKKCQYTDEAFKHIEVCRETDCKAPRCPKRERLKSTLYVFDSGDGHVIVVAKTLDLAYASLEEWVGLTEVETREAYKFLDTYLLDEGTVINLETG